ncbi:hypothetical protein UlMin_031396 [Ulmus minor]
MEGQSSNNDKDVPQVPKDDPNQHILMAAGRSWSQTDALHLPWWIQSTEPSLNYVKFLAESSAFTPRAREDMLESLPSQVSSTYPGSGVAELQRDMSFNPLAQACGSKSTHIDAWKNHTSLTQSSNLDNHNEVSSVPIQCGRAASPGSQSQPRSNELKQKTVATDRQRRVRIAERVHALQELLPHSSQGCQASVLDDFIDHVKFLQLQIKDIYKSRLTGEATNEHIIFREGYGHFSCSQQMFNEPLEEMMGKLLELNPLAAMELLEMKGLLIVPIDLIEGSARPSAA